MRNSLKFKNPLLSLVRFKSKSSSTNGNKKDQQTIERLDHEATILFGEPLKNDRRKSRKKLKIDLEDDSLDECVYYEISKNGESPVNPAVKNQIIDETPVKPFNQVESPMVSSVHIPSQEFNEISINEPVLLFPLFNETKKEYVSGQHYYINPMRKRMYKTFPTVTAILTETMTDKAKSLLNRWKDNQIADLGKDKFEEQQRKQLQMRNILLKLIQKRLLGVQTEDLDVLPEFEGCWKSLECVFPLFSKVVAMEKMVTHSELLYKGMIDSIVEYKNKPVLVSWKKSSKLKSSIDMTFDAPIQTAAYIGALNYDDSYSFKIEESLLVMSYDDGSKADIFHLKKENCLHYWKSWLQRLHLYQTNHKKLESEEQERGPDKSEPFRKETTEKPKGFDSSVYSTFMNVPATPQKRSKKTEELQISFPIYNELKKEYVAGQLYEIKPVKQTIHSGYPSVTGILGETKSDSSKFVLQRWKNNLIAQLGEEGFEKYHKNLLETGSLLHSLIQQRLLGTAEKDLDIVPELVGCWKSLEGVFRLFSDIKITESNVVHKELKYKGVIDCIAEFRGKPMIIDWKKSDKIKSSIDMTYDAPLQIAAYIAATNYDEFYPFKIEEGLLIMSYIDGTKADIFYLNKESLQRYWNLWLQRLAKYQNMSKANDLKIDY